MNLISCNTCGVVLDSKKIKWPTEKEIYLEDGSLDYTKVKWDGDDYVRYIKCPTCNSEVAKE